MTRTHMWIAASALALAASSGAALAQEVAREDTVIFDLDRTIKDPKISTGLRRYQADARCPPDNVGAAVHPELCDRQYRPMAGDRVRAERRIHRITISLREGVEWSDGEAFNAHDVVFTVNMAMTNEEISSRKASTIRSQVASVEKVDDLTVKFTLNSANPRFIVENFGVRIFGSFLIMPEHIWSGEDAATFTFSSPIGTGPYTFTSATTSRRDLGSQ